MQTFLKVGSVMGIAALFLVGFLFLRTPATPQAIDQSQFGSVAGPNVTGDCLTVNGVTTCHARVAFSPGTTTPVAINIGQFGSSTLLRVTTYEPLASTSMLTLARANTAYATTTYLDEVSVTANSQPYTVYTATTTSGTAATLGKNTFGPGVGSKYLVLGIAAGSVTTNGPAGVLEATWQLNQ